MKRTALVIGAAGFIGRHVCKTFNRAGYRVVGIGIEPPENAPLAFLDGYHSLTIPTTTGELGGVVRNNKPFVCIHCAGRSSVPHSILNPLADFRAGVDVTFEILDNLRLFSPGTRLIFLSSAAVYGDPVRLPVDETAPIQPISPYGFHKRICEELCAEFTGVYGVPTAIARVFSAYGPGLRRQVVWDLCSKMLDSTTVKLQGIGEESRDFIHVYDVSRALLLLAEGASCKAEAYNLASGSETRISELVELMRHEIGQSSCVEYDGVVPAGTPQNWCADVSRMVELGFMPEIELASGLHQVVKLCRAELQGA